MKVIPGTSVIHAHTFAKALGAEVVEDLGRLENPEWLFWVGANPSSRAAVESLRAKGFKVALYWIGSDSLCAITQRSFRKNIPEVDIHFSVHERIQRELKTWGVDSNVIYPCARNYYKAEDVPARQETGHVVGIYSPTPGPDDLYMHDECVDVAKENPYCKFIFYGAQSYNNLPENCIDAGKMTPEDTKDIYSKVSCILRLCKHDGFPVGGIEAKIRNLHVIENYPYPGFKLAETLEDVTKFLQEEETHKEDVGPWPSFYRERFSPEAFQRKVNSFLR